MKATLREPKSLNVTFTDLRGTVHCGQSDERFVAEGLRRECLMGQVSGRFVLKAAPRLLLWQ